jgi:hypothetical protein
VRIIVRRSQGGTDSNCKAPPIDWTTKGADSRKPYRRRSDGAWQAQIDTIPFKAVNSHGDSRGLRANHKNKQGANTGKQDARHRL